MPRNYRPRRKMMRRRRPLAKVTKYNAYGQARRVAVGRRHKRGFLSIVRKTQLITLSNTGVAGSPVLADPNINPVVTIGTPTLSPGFGSDVYDIPFSMRFELSQLVAASDITSLADQYKIIGAYVRLFYNITGASGGVGSTAQSMPFVQHITDHDDATVPDVIQIRQKMGLKFKTFKNTSSYIGLMCRPVPSSEIYAAGAAYGIPGRAPWINSTNPTVPHYAIKGVLCQVPLPALSATNGQSVFTFDVALKVLAKDFQ